MEDDEPAEAKRTGREAADARTLPEEFVDEMRSNRFTPPPEPAEEGEGTS